jgi:hypothetical protein
MALPIVVLDGDIDMSSRIESTPGAAAGGSVHERCGAIASAASLRVICSLPHAIAALALLAVFLSLTAISKASATAPTAADNSAPADLLDVYLGVTNMNRCCNCHTDQC